MNHLHNLACSLKRAVVSAAGIICVVMSWSVTADAGIRLFESADGGTARVQAVNGTYVLSNDMLSASFVGNGGSLRFGGCEALGLQGGTELFALSYGADSTTVYASEMRLERVATEDLPADTAAFTASLRLPGKAVVATLSSGELEVEWRAILRDGSHYLRTELTITSKADVAMRSITAMIYRVAAEKAPAVVGNTRGAILASPTLFAGLETPTGINTVSEPESGVSLIEGLWSRHAMLHAGSSWNVSAVVGVVVPGQIRRSVLAYSERERAVPWRPMVNYNSWYELNIDRNNSPTYDNHMTSDECVAIVDRWNRELYGKYGVNVDAFVWDDGWDSYGTWTFNRQFPHGFEETDSAAAAGGAGIGTWLGPVGGYGGSGEMRRGFWADRGGMQLSNPAYYKTFLDACKYMIDNYDFRFFKLDGISAQFSSTGPDAGYVGEENAEGIINILREVRKLRPDMFFNTTVGTWASPFWFHFTDAVWRQEADFATIGDQGDDRERWITYRDNLVHQNFVTGSPLCPINTLMTHGVILTRNGDVSKTMDYEGIVRELRCAFACGSGMVELYCDADLLDSIGGGALWGDIADCIKWQKANADVLPDVHWVGGDPWDGEKADVYGWAAWNGDKAVLTLRNPTTKPQYYTFRLREALDVPVWAEGGMRFGKAFVRQADLAGFTTARPIGYDDEITVLLPALSVFVFDGER